MNTPRGREISVASWLWPVARSLLLTPAVLLKDTLRAVWLMAGVDRVLVMWRGVIRVSGSHSARLEE